MYFQQHIPTRTRSALKHDFDFRVTKKGVKKCFEARIQPESAPFTRAIPTPLRKSCTRPTVPIITNMCVEDSTLDLSTQQGLLRDFWQLPDNDVVRAR
jgi:hypothetical protein